MSNVQLYTLPQRLKIENDFVGIAMTDLHKELQIDGSNQDHLAVLWLMLWMLPMTAGEVRVWTVSQMDGTARFIVVRKVPTFKRTFGGRVVQRIEFYALPQNTSPEMAAAEARACQSDLVSILVGCPGRSAAIRANSKAARILKLYSAVNANILAGVFSSRHAEGRFDRLLTLAIR
jgi:hypothetical protein